MELLLSVSFYWYYLVRALELLLSVSFYWYYLVRALCVYVIEII